MDKSESEILEEWDLVSMDNDTEQEKNQNEKKNDVQAGQSKNSVDEGNGKNVTEVNVSSKKENDASEKTSENGIDSEEKNDDVLKIAEADASKNSESVITNVTVSEETVEADSKAETELHSEKEVIDEEAGAEGDVEEMSEPDTEEITVIETIMYDVKKISDVESEKNIAANIEKITSANTKDASQVNNLGACDITPKTNNDKVTEECFDVKASDIKLKEIDNQLKGDIDDHIIKSSVEQSESSSVLPEMYPTLVDPENASIESSSSDIDIIDENIEDSVTSSFLSPVPLSLSISSSVDTSSVLTSPSDEDKSTRIEEIKQPEKPELFSVEPESLPKKPEFNVEETIAKKPLYEYGQSFEEKKENVHQKSQQRRDTQSSVFGAILHFLRNMKCLEWSLLGGVVIGLYLTIVFNQTNIFAVVEKEDVVVQMKKMIDDLKYDNKLLKDQMLSEMKNEKVFSSFEHQIKELRKENSRLNHMLYDVAKVLEKQKDTHDKYEKKETEYLAPFKKEINKLKEQINSLKIDNEELQKQLVRIRYASYSQGGKDVNDDKNRKEKEEIKKDETSSSDDIPIDINSLKKWNELISLLSKKLDLSLETDPKSKDKSYSESRRNISWYWKVFFREFEGSFKEFKANITSKFSDYKKVHENTISDIYKFVKNFFTVEEGNNQQFIPPGEESSRWNNFGDFFNDLKNKWSKIKDRIDTSDLKRFFNDFKMPGNEETPQYESQKAKSSPYEHNERKPATVHVESEKKPTTVHNGLDRKYDKVQKDSEDTKWMFERAALRAELRDTEKEDEVNWFLKKSKHLSKDDTKEKKY